MLPNLQPQRPHLLGHPPLAQQAQLPGPPGVSGPGGAGIVGQGVPCGSNPLACPGFQAGARFQQPGPWQNAAPAAGHPCPSYPQLQQPGLANHPGQCPGGVGGVGAGRPMGGMPMLPSQPPGPFASGVGAQLGAAPGIAAGFGSAIGGMTPQMAQAPPPLLQQPQPFFQFSASVGGSTFASEVAQAAPSPQQHLQHQQHQHQQQQQQQPQQPLQQIQPSGKEQSRLLPSQTFRHGDGRYTRTTPQGDEGPVEESCGSNSASEGELQTPKKSVVASLWGRFQNFKNSVLDPALEHMANMEMSRRPPQAIPLPQGDAHLNSVSIEYSEAAVREATKDFDQSCVLGSGAFGQVYRGKMQDGSEVAVKVLKVPDEAGFEDEVKVLSRFRHPNLVILMGFARHAEGGARSLIYEYLSGGDVSGRLARSRSRVQPFGSCLRLAVSCDAASGLSHLHNARPRAFHRDIKCANILLDRNGTAKMADFGLACVSAVGSAEKKVQQASFTPGYVCPEYVRTGVVTEANEVHSFGMVLLELLSGIPPAVVRDPKNPQDLDFPFAHINGSVDSVLEMLDVTASFQGATARATAQLALRCISPALSERPLFVNILDELRHLHDPDYVNPIHAKPARPPAGVSVSRDAAGCSAAKPALPQSHLDVPNPVADDGTLCCLSCIFAEDVDIAAVEAQLCTINFPAHEQQLFVGRTEQPASMWSLLVPNEHLRSTISRQHFKITKNATGDECTPAFYVSCMSQNGMLVNDEFIAPSQQERRVQHGDTIALVAAPERTGAKVGSVRKPFVAFSFRSLRGASLLLPQLPHSTSTNAVEQSELPAHRRNLRHAVKKPELHVPRTGAKDSVEQPEMLASRLPEGVSTGWWLGEHGERQSVPADAIFYLELHGDPVCSDLPAEHRRLYLRSGAAAGSLLINSDTLRVGRRHQRGFWQRVLRPGFYADGSWPFIAADHFEVTGERQHNTSSNCCPWAFSAKILDQAGVAINHGLTSSIGEVLHISPGDALTIDIPARSEQSATLETIQFTFVYCGGLQAYTQQPGSGQKDHFDIGDIELHLDNKPLRLPSFASFTSDGYKENMSIEDAAVSLRRGRAQTAPARAKAAGVLQAPVNLEALDLDDDG